MGRDKACSWLFLLLLAGGNSFVVHGLASPSTPPPNKTLLSGKRIVVVGGGPVGLYFAALLSSKDPTCQIEILEKRSTSSINAFGLGVSKRMQHRLKDVPGLLEKATSISAHVDSLDIPLVSRDDLTQQMSDFVLEKFGTNCQLKLGEECEQVDFDAQTITTSNGRTVKYDLLLGADGVNSKIRQWILEAEAKEDDDSTTTSTTKLVEERYLESGRWKALRIPKQPDIEIGSFKPLRHPSLGGGRVLPKAPEGHILLMFWTDNLDNPEGVATTEDLKQMITDAMRDKKSSKWSRFNPLRKVMGFDQGDSIKKDRTVVFDEPALEQFIESRAGKSHHLRINKYHYKDSVALIGDSAHAFNSLLGQGCATGLESSHTLVDALSDTTTTTTDTPNKSLGDALNTYTNKATKEAHAITELSLINYGIRGKFWVTIRALPLILWNMVRGRGLLKRIVDVTIPFSQIAAENKRVLKICRHQFEKERKPFPTRTTCTTN